MNVYFTSDLHFGHKNILSFGQRKHDDIFEMHEAIIDSWNNTIRKKGDIVYVLGDIAMHPDFMPLFDRMRGRKRLVLGNHDMFHREIYELYFGKVYHFHKSYGGIVLTHIPIHPGELLYRSWKWNVHGHIHRKEQDIDDSRYFNVNIDVIGYNPISLDEVKSNLVVY